MSVLFHPPETEVSNFLEQWTSAKISRSYIKTIMYYNLKLSQIAPAENAFEKACIFNWERKDRRFWSHNTLNTTEETDRIIEFIQ